MNNIEKAWFALGEQKAHKVEQVEMIGSKSAVRKQKTLSFYPIDNRNEYQLRARGYFLAGLLGVTLFGNKFINVKLVHRLESSAKERGFIIKEVDPLTHQFIPSR